MTSCVRPGCHFMTPWVRLYDELMKFWVRPSDQTDIMSDTGWSRNMRDELLHALLWERLDDQFMALWVWPDSVFLSLGEEPDDQFITLWVRRDDQTDIMCNGGWSLYDTKSEFRNSRIRGEDILSLSEYLY